MEDRTPNEVKRRKSIYNKDYQYRMTRHLNMTSYQTSIRFTTYKVDKY